MFHVEQPGPVDMPGGFPTEFHRMKIKTGFFFAFFGGLLGFALFSELYRHLTTPRARLKAMVIQLPCGITFGDAVELVRNHANANRCEVETEFNGHRLHACQFEHPLCIIEKFTVNRQMQWDREAEAEKEARKTRGAQIIREAMADIDRNQAGEQPAATETETGRDLRA